MKMELGIESIPLPYKNNTNTNFLQDIWLYKNCNLPFIAEQLSDNNIHYWANIIPFSSNSISIVNISHSYFFDNDSVLFTESNKSILIFGDTSFLEVLDMFIIYICDLIQYIENKKYTYLIIPDIFKEQSYCINFFGCDIFIKNNKMAFDENFTDTIDNFPMPLTKLNFPNWKLSFDLEDLKHITIEQLFFSNNQLFISAEMYKNIEKYDIGTGIKAGRFDIPNYILKYIN